MAKSSIQAYGAEGMSTALWFDPEKLLIVGLDCPEDVCPELADPDRVTPDPNTFEGLVQSILTHGNKQAIQVRKLAKGDDQPVYVVHGRQRVMAAREANRRIKKARGDVFVRILGTVDQASDAKGSAITNIVANEHNRAKSILERARDAQRMRDMGHDEAEIGAMFGVTRGALASWRALLSAPVAVLAKVQAGEISASTAAELGKLPPQEQAAALATALEAEGGKDGGNVRERIRAQRTPGTGAQREDAAKDPAWKPKAISDFIAWMDPAQNEKDDPADEVQRAIYETLLYMQGKTNGKALKAFCGGRLYDWAREYAPATKRAVKETRAKGKKK